MKYEMFRAATLFIVSSLIIPLLSAAQGPAIAAGSGGCDAFEWPLATELKWMQAADSLSVESGATIEVPPLKSIALALKPEAEVLLAVPATGTPKSIPDRPFTGTITVASLEKSGVYKVTISGPGWIDAMQDGQTLNAQSHTGKSDCPGIRKSVRFVLKQGPVTLQITSAQAQNIRIAIRRVE